MGVYVQQKAQAAYREEEWNFPFDEWKELWFEDNKWDNRGRHAGGYRMRRLDAALPWCKENVTISNLVFKAKNRRPVSSRKPIKHGTGHYSKCRPCVAEGKKYDSVCDAGKDLGYDKYAVKYRLNAVNYTNWYYQQETTE